MKREEEIIETAKFIYSPSSGIPQSLPMRVGFIEGAKWADKTMIERAVNWLVHNMASGEYLGLHDTIIKPDFISKFKKAMKGE